MTIYPAVDMKDGRCVRLVQGDLSNSTVYYDRPVDAAKKWQAEGAEYIHLVDLNGAKEGRLVNIDAISEIAKAVELPLQLGGGIRCMESLEALFSVGISRAIIGTAAVENVDFLQAALDKYGDAIAVGIDARDGFAATHAWEKSGEVRAVELAKKVAQMGVSTIIYTDIATDGMLTGPNLSAMKEMADSVNISVIASGGVSRLEDIINLKATGVTGVIVGKALYSGSLSLNDALKNA